MKKVSVAIVGAGSRGLTAYGEYLRKHPDQADVVAVAEPREYFRNEAVRRLNIPADGVFETWEDLLDKPRLADAIIIATGDRMHTEPALVAAEKGYHIMLEKPMAPTPEECIRITRAVQKNDVILAVCHVLQYAPLFAKVREFIDDGTLGEVCSIQHMEGIAWWHYAHSYVRGNWRNEASSSFILMAKSCHDVDLLLWWAGQKCRSTQSFGHLKHFRRENAPAEAADRCMDCPLGDDICPYSAKKFYFQRLRAGRHGRPLDIVVEEFTEEALAAALREGPYGRCVYKLDNDVCDSQIVNFDFENGVTASLTLSAFTPYGRMIRVMGSRGYLEGEKHALRLLDFRTGNRTEMDINEIADLGGGHGGGDPRLTQAFIDAVRKGDQGLIRTGPEVTLESHLMTFAAERSRREGRIVQMSEMYERHPSLV